MVQVIFPDGDGIFKDDNTQIHPAHVVENWYEEYECDLENMEWHHNLQISILLSICGATWSDELVTVTLYRRIWKS